MEGKKKGAFLVEIRPGPWKARGCSKTPKDGRIYAPTFSGFLPAPLPATTLRPPPFSLPCCFFHRRRRRRRRRRSLAERASFRESVARFSLAHGVTDKRAGEGTIKRDGNCTGCSSLTRTTVIQDKINRGKIYIYICKNCNKR